MTPLAPLPVTLLTGFLGVGKTRALNHLLTDPLLQDTAVLINEIGEIALDHLLVKEVKDGIILLSNGCLCCSMRGELITALEELLKARDNHRIPPFTRLMIETTGLADPVPIMNTLLAHPYLAMRFKLEGIVTLVDSVNGLETLENFEEARRQVALADKIYITKTDLHPASEGLLAKIHALNPQNMLLSTLTAQEVTTIASNRATWLKEFAELPHTSDIASYCLESDKPMPLHHLNLFLDLLRGQYASQILRVKAIVKLTETPDRPVIIHGAQHLIHPLEYLEAWPSEERTTRLVFIVKDLEKRVITALFNAFLGLPALDSPDKDALLHNPLKLF